MNGLIIHLFKKDVRRLRILLCLWFLLIIFECLLVGRGSTTAASDIVLTYFYSVLGYLVPMFELLLVLILVPLVIQDEPLVGTDAFWFTRPISRKMLLKTKALFALCLLILPPLIAQTVVLLSNHINPSDILLAIVQIFLKQTAWILTVSAIAVVTPNFARFALYFVGGFILMTLAAFLVQMLNLYYSATALVELQTQGVGLLNSRTLMTMIWSCAFGSFILVFQYLTRRTRTTWALIGTGIAGIFLLGNLWKIDFLSGFAKSHSEKKGEQADLSKVEISLDKSSTWVSDNPQIRANEAPKRQMSAKLRISGVPEGVFVKTALNESSLKFSDEKLVKTEHVMDRVYRGNEIDSSALENLLTSTRVVNKKRNYSSDTILQIDDADYQKYLGQSAAYTGKFTLTAYRYQLDEEIPLKKGVRKQKNSEQIFIRDVLRQPKGVDITLVEQYMSLLFKPSTFRSQFSMFKPKDRFYVLYNKAKNEIFLPEDDYNFDMSSILNHNDILQFSNQRLRYTSVPESGRTKVRIPDLDEAWLEQAVLLKIVSVEAGEVSRSINDNLRLGDHLSRFSFDEDESKKQKADLTKIVLPPNPSREQVEKYVNDIVSATSGQVSFSSDDPAVSKLVQVGADHLDILLNANSDNYYLQTAVDKLVRKQDKDLVLKNLAQHKYLSTCVMRYGWQEDARETLIQGLDDRYDNYLLPDWIRAVVSLKDPKTYPALTDYFIHGQNRSTTYHEIKKLPDLDLSKAINEAWTASRDDSAFEQRTMGMIAMKNGNPEALKYCMGLLKKMDSHKASTAKAKVSAEVKSSLDKEIAKLDPKSPARQALEKVRKSLDEGAESDSSDESEPLSQYEKEELQRSILSSIDFVGSVDQIVEWYQQNESKLVFDPAKARFIDPSSTQTRTMDQTSSTNVTTTAIDGGPSTSPEKTTPSPSVRKKTLEEIVLPPNANEAQMKDYIEEIVEAGKGVTIFSSDAPEIKKLMAIGHSNLHLLLERGLNNFFVMTTVMKMVTAEDKELVLKYLPLEKNLASLVIKFKWANDARTILVGKLREHPDYLPSPWLKAIASLNDPSLNEDLKTYFVYGRNKSATYWAIHNIPGLDLKKEVDNAWEESKTKGSGYEERAMAEIAMENGNLSALNRCVTLLQGQTDKKTADATDDENETAPSKLPKLSSTERKRMETALTNLVDTKGSLDEILAWVKSNENKLSYDPVKKKFVITVPKEGASKGPEDSDKLGSSSSFKRFCAST